MKKTARTSFNSSQRAVIALSEEEHATNKLRSRIRVRCEHVFGRMSQMAMDQLRTIGLVRAKQHNALCNLVYNMDRYAFLRR